jgi:uncharacterized protein
MPASTPHFRPTVKLDGNEHERLTSLLKAMEFAEHSDGLSSLELRVDNIASLTSGSAEFAFDAGGDLELGDEIIVGAGSVSAPVEIFRGYVTGIEAVFEESAAPVLVILAEDALQKARMKRRSKVYEGATLASIARDIAAGLSLTPQVSGLDQSFGTQVQMNESDLAFLRRLLARVDADVQVVGRELHVAPRQSVNRGSVDLILGDNLREARITADFAHQVDKTAAAGWDAGAGSAISAVGTDNATGPGSGDKSAPLLTRTLGARSEHTGHLAFFDRAEAEAVANAARNRRARQFLRISGIADGDPLIRVGTQARVTGVGKWFSNTYQVTETRHRFDTRSGYRVEFIAECAFLGRDGR